ncbi:cytochrome C biogenesis protein CcdA [Aeromicrobium sp. A1-2]|uniref:cytochrome c biogenesis CcdA family protein n=1 Tax=Aeromicrobium sp. A1-2 TaxID=2107713 RepID=UPI000E4EE86C|nr:cytochrome c biogenesis CcdA family protein [Aeromicrobium sp. A1-2]AXT85798.1 cytochrome C biogenesis protein CcdA [Aeromicrobium sp. A1-2]
MTTIGLTGAFLGGVLTLLSPCSAVLLPSFFAYAFGSRAAVLARTGVFYLGLVVTLVPLGVAASSVGAFFNSHRDGLVLILSIMVITFGLLQILGISFGLLRRRATRGSVSSGTGVIQIFALGTVYGVAGVCSGPILGSVLAVAGMRGSPAYGGLLLAVYALGMCVPLAVLAVFWERLDVNGRKWLIPRSIDLGPIHTSSTAVISGTILIGVGTLLLVSGGTANLGGIIGADAQFSIELWAGRVGERIPDAVVLIVVATLATSALLARRWWTQAHAKAEAGRR